MKISLEESEFEVSDMHITKHAKIHGVMMTARLENPNIVMENYATGKAVPTG